MTTIADLNFVLNTLVHVQLCSFEPHSSNRQSSITDTQTEMELTTQTKELRMDRGQPNTSNTNYKLKYLIRIISSDGCSDSAKSHSISLKMTQGSRSQSSLLRRC
ncbi:unnamed protein product [Dicrocoelium dendriticum]|nr:unnamed protein product [Dicrocoelium dendriticum]